MIPSRTMHLDDYKQMEAEGAFIEEVHIGIKMWYEYQHQHRLWEYALAVKVLKEHFANDPRKNLVVSDHGCGAGYLSPLLLWLGHHVLLYECWTFGSEEQFMMEQMRRVFELRKDAGGSYQMRNRPLGKLTQADRPVDAAFCVSTLEHIVAYQDAFVDLLKTVDKGGLVFITSDFGEHEKDDYIFNNLRAGKMFTKDTYRELELIARSMDFAPVGGQTEWEWSEECRLVHNYGFASMALKRGTV